MRTILFSTAVALLIGGAACKETDKTELQKTQERVGEQREELTEQREDVREEKQDVVEEQRDVAEEQRDVTQTQQELQQLQERRDLFTTSAKEKLNRIDARLAELEGDPQKKQQAIELRARRNAIITKLDKAGEQTESTWNEFERGVGTEMDELERDVENVGADRNEPGMVE